MKTIRNYIEIAVFTLLVEALLGIEAAASWVNALAYKAGAKAYKASLSAKIDQIVSKRTSLHAKANKLNAKGYDTYQRYLSLDATVLQLRKDQEAAERAAL